MNMQIILERKNMNNKIYNLDHTNLHNFLSERTSAIMLQ